MDEFLYVKSYINTMASKLYLENSYDLMNIVEMGDVYEEASYGEFSQRIHVFMQDSNRKVMKLLSENSRAGKVMRNLKTHPEIAKKQLKIKNYKKLDSLAENTLNKLLHAKMPADVSRIKRDYKKNRAVIKSALSSITMNISHAVSLLEKMRKSSNNEMLLKASKVATGSKSAESRKDATDMAVEICKDSMGDVVDMIKEITEEIEDWTEDLKDTNSELEQRKEQRNKNIEKLNTYEKRSRGGEVNPKQQRIDDAFVKWNHQKYGELVKLEKALSNMDEKDPNFKKLSKEINSLEKRITDNIKHMTDRLDRHRVPSERDIDKQKSKIASDDQAILELEKDKKIIEEKISSLKEELKKLRKRGSGR